MSLPPPVTRKSKKKDLWAEIVALRDEISAQQEAINNMKRERGYVLDRLATVQSQVSASQFALRGELKWT